MELEYRIARKGENYFPQVRIKRFLLWSRWKRIGEHTGGSFGLYDLPNWEYPRTKIECKNIILKFDVWFHNNDKVEYYKYEIA